MTELKEILRALQAHIPAREAAQCPNIFIHHIEYLKYASALSDNVLYISSASDTRLEEASASENQFAVFVACPATAPLPTRDARIIPVFLDAKRLHAMVSRILGGGTDDRALLDLLLLARCGAWSVSLFTHALSETLNMGIFIFNADYQLISGCLPAGMEDSYGAALLRSATLSTGQLSDIINGTGDGPVGGIRRLINRLTLDHGLEAAVLLLSRGAPTCPPDMLFSGIARHLSELIRLHPDAPWASGMNHNPLNSILNGSISSEAQIRKTLGEKPGNYLYQLMAADLDAGTDYSQLRRCFSAAFSDSQTVIYAGKLYAFIRFSDDIPPDMDFVRPVWLEKGLRPGWDYARFEQALAKAGAHACYSAAFHRPALIRSIASLCAGALDIARRLDVSRGRIRLHSEDEYLMYLIYEQAIPHFLQHNPLADAKCFLYPDVCSLIKYDLQHGTDLCTVLYTYLSSNLNANRTSELLYMHRNTVYNKLKMIQKILKTDFQSSQLFSFYLESLKLYMYFSRYLGLDMEKMLLN